MSVTVDLGRRLVAEALGAAILVATVVGSGIMADRLTDDVAVSLLGNTIATGAILFVLISIFGPISGAHFNPVVTMVFAVRREIEASVVGPYVLAQIIGGVFGTVVAHAMFDLPILQVSETVRAGSAQWFAEAVATFGLLLTILGGLRFRVDAIPSLVGPLHHCHLLVHGVDLVRQPGGRDCEKHHEHLLRNPSSRPAGLHRRANHRGAARRRSCRVAVRRSTQRDLIRPSKGKSLTMDVTINHNPRLRDIEEHVGDDPQRGDRADGDRISQDTADARRACEDDRRR
jgi:hypothetical protein